MMSKAPRWQDTLVNSKANKAMQKKMGKDSKFSSGKQSANTRSGVTVGRSHSLGTRDLSSGGKGGGSTQEQNHAGLKNTRTGSQSSKPGIRLCSSRSFSSLHSSSFPAAPLIRSSRSLGRLDQRGRDEKNLDFGKCSTSLETLRDCKNSPSKNSRDMKASLSEQTRVSSSVATCHHHSNTVKKQTRDGVYTLCAMTSGLRRNWVQAVLRNVRPSATPAINSRVEQSARQERSKSLDKKYDGYAEDIRDKDHQNYLECLKEQKQVKQSNADSTTSHIVPASALPPPISPSISSATPPTNPLHNQEEVSSDNLVQNAVNEISNNACLHGDLNALLKHNIETATALEKDGQQSINNSSSLCAQEEGREKHTGQLAKELEKTQKELSQLQQINKTLQDELEQEKAKHPNEMSFGQSDSISTSASSLDQVDVQCLQKTKQDHTAELEAQRYSQVEATEAELCRGLLAEQEHLLFSSDATTLAQTQLELDRRHFKEKQMQLEQIILSLKSKLQSSEEKRAEAENCLTQVQQEMQGLCDLQQEANQLREHYQEVTTQLRAYEDTQAQKEARLEQHLMLLQASQERERKSLAASLTQAEKRSQDLQEQLRQAEEEVENLKSQEWTKEIQEAQEQLQVELQQTVSAMEELQEEKDHLEQQCQELLGQVHELTGEVNRLQDRLKTDETQFYNLEHSYESVSEELQVAMGKVRQWETETQEMREGYERQLDQKEQELNEILLKMEVLGNSLEETEMRLNDALKKEDKEKKLFVDDTEKLHVDGSMRLRSINQSPGLDGEDPDRFTSIIQFLETKLYETEEKLRDITQRLEDYQSHASCQDPLLCSQLTQTRANAQHLGLLLHTQAKNNQRFAQQMENRCRMLVGRFQVALNIVQACRGKLQEAGSLIDIEDFEKQLATLVNCLKQGEKDAEKQQHESRYACREEERIFNDKMLTENGHFMEDVPESVGKSLAREIFVVETMVTLLQSKNVIGQLQVIQKENGGSLSQRYQSLLTQIIALKAQSRNDDMVESAVSSACVEAELVYKVYKFQQQNFNLQEIQPFELESYGENEEKENKAMHKPTKANGHTTFYIWGDLVSTLQKRATFLHQVSQDISETITHQNTDLKWMQEQAKIIYLTHRLYLDLKQVSENSSKVETNGLDQEVNERLCHLEEVNCTLREELEQAEKRVRMVESGNQKLLEDIKKIENYHEERMQKLEGEFQDKIQELQRIHEEEMKHLHDYYSKSCFSKEKLNKMTGKSASSQSHNGAESNMEELDKSERFSALEDMHKKLISDLQQQHQKEVAKLLKEKDQLLKEETAATMAAIVAMRRSHKEELEKTRYTTNIRENADMSELHIEYEKELQTLNKDLEVLSVQHTQKCLENSQLNQELQQERKTLMQYQRENQELKKKQRQANDISPFHSLKTKHLTPKGTDTYEMEIILRAREAEMQFLRQEAQSLKEDLKLARLDTIYAQNKLKSLCMGTPDEKLLEDLKWATWCPGQQGQSQMFPEEAGTNQCDATVQDKTVISQPFRAVRSQSLKEGLSVQEKMTLFES